MCGRFKLEERSERENEQAAVVESDDQTARVFRRRPADEGALPDNGEEE